MDKIYPWTWRTIEDYLEGLALWLGLAGLVLASILLDASSLEQSSNGEHDEQRRTKGVEARTGNHCTNGQLGAPPAGMARWIHTLPDPCTAVDTMATNPGVPEHRTAVSPD